MDPSNDPFGYLHINQMELYPRRRVTEYYSASRPSEEYQSRLVEHPRDKLTRKDASHRSARGERIMPPRNSDMRMFRNSYFS
ncbi:uncharacterized protein [Musca autumnalis]|uniref:uncharacterized protein n=1 Tax=Musca autumnalis TaxID=221902 RepID=UPI003CF76F2F